MKYVFSSILIIFISYNVSSQILQVPKEGKALVYIMRSNNLGGALNFRVYDKDRYLGALPQNAYFTYECDPGEHLFWAASENRDFVEATLEPNKVYVIDLRAKMGVFIAAVGAEPYSPDNPTHVKRLKKVLNKHINAVVLDSGRSKEKDENISKAMEAYNRIKEKENSKIKKLLPNMNFKLN
jgi:hypothetical protein